MNVIPDTIHPTPIGPFHVLMSRVAGSGSGGSGGGGSDNGAGSPSSSSSSSSSPGRLVDPRQERDYVSRRRKAFFDGPEYSKLLLLPPAHQQQKRHHPSSPWYGVTGIEQELVNCCEKQEDRDEGSDPSEGGALDIEKEIEFTALMARDCHTMATRCLALGILERTLHAYLLDVEAESAKEQENIIPEPAEVPSEKQAAKEVKDLQEIKEGTSVKEEPNEDIETEQRAASNEENDDGSTKPPGWKRRSPRHRKEADQRQDQQQQPPQKRQKTAITKVEKVPDKTEVSDMNRGDWIEGEEVDRLEQFLAAGGLKILNRWLIEASVYEPTPVSIKGPHSSKSHSNNTEKPPAMRPLIVPILRFLEKIPFDKKVVVESKINKQIRKLGKQVDSILEARARGKHRQADLENWTTDMSVSATDALDNVKEAVEIVKASWENMAKKQDEKFTDPFESLKSQMRDRLEVLEKFEQGEIGCPKWLELPGMNKEAKKSTVPRRTTTQELAAKERQAEREGLKNRLRAAENERREHVARLREQLRKRQEEAAAKPVVQSESTKKVVWKDGLRTQVNRNRKLLEETFVFIKESPASSKGDDGTEVHTGDGDATTDESKEAAESVQVDENVRT